MEEIIIEPLLPGEWQEYKLLRLEALKYDPQAFGDKYEEWVNYSNEKWQERPNNPATTIFIAKDAGKYIGMVGIYINEKYEKKRGDIWGMYVNNVYRGKGIGKLLMLKALEKLRAYTDIESAYLHVSPQQEVATKLYTSLGFQLIKTEKWNLGDEKTYDVLVMEKKLH